MAIGKRIVIAGATGLIGAQLVRRLSQRGDLVVVLARDPERARTQAPGAADYIAWSSSMTDGPWTKAIDGADVVVNLAGSSVAVRWTETERKKIRESRIDGTRNLVGAMERAERKPGAFINGSAVGYYGTSETTSFTESSPPGHNFLADVCVDWEAEGLKAEALGIRVVLVRTGVVLEPHGGVMAKVLPTFKAFIGGPMGSGRQWFPWIHMEDEIEILLWAIDNENVAGALNAVAPEPVTYKEFSTTLGRILHRPSLLPVPPFVLHLMLGEASLIVLEGQRVIPEKLRELGYTFRFPKLEGALLDLVQDQ